MRKREREVFLTGLTLVELLVVIAILVLLAGIVASVMTHAIKAAKISKCTSNLSQIGKALDLYLEDNSGYFPPYDVMTAGLVRLTKFDAKGLVLAMEPYGPVPSMWHCPLDPHAGMDFKDGGLEKFHTDTSYVYGTWLVLRRDKDSKWFSFNVSSVEHPSLTTCLTEDGWGNDPMGPDEPHGKRRNNLYFDWHVKDVSTLVPPCDFPGQNKGCPE